MNLKNYSMLLIIFTLGTINLKAQEQLLKEIQEDCNILKINKYNTIQEAIKNLVENYRRAFTLIEIGLNEAPYAIDLAKADKYQSSYIALLLEQSGTFISKVVDQNLQNIIVLNPKNITSKEFTIFSHCEHIDVVLVHDITSSLKSEFIRSLDAILTLGQHTFIEVDAQNSLLLYELEKRKCKIVVSNPHKVLFYHFYQKDKLTLHRWNIHDRPYNNKEYIIKSTFNEKFLIKSKANNITSPWAPGINLKTFLMLYGTYPTDAIIAKEIKAMRYSVPRHNDLALPNMVIQGCKVIPIDIKDTGNEILVETFIKIILECVFNGDNKRLVDPRESWHCYSRLKKKLIIPLR